ncbi:MAG: peptidoglycan editing factor PgeF [Gammaproteobacteria bacterium]|nr:peptidoglycan editing factor PgeF [Gammaproteobacteria bacterium]
MSKAHGWITPGWPAPPNVRAISTTRLGGVSTAPYDSFNLGDHVGDNPAHVSANRARLTASLQLPNSPAWLRQVHGTHVVNAAGAERTADAAYTAQPGIVCGVLTADCLPLLLCDAQGTRVAAVHAGWRGLAAGVIEAALDAMGAGKNLLAWLGPAIGPRAFEVGSEVREVFMAHDAEAQQAFQLSGGGRWLADIFQLARQRLAAHGLTQVYGGSECTYSNAQRFYSYRRDGETGRMATLIWLEKSSK